MRDIGWGGEILKPKNKKELEAPESRITTIDQRKPSGEDIGKAPGEKTMTEKAFTLASISGALAVTMSSVRPSESSFDDPKHDFKRLYASRFRVMAAI